MHQQEIFPDGLFAENHGNLAVLGEVTDLVDADMGFYCFWRFGIKGDVEEKA
jgi:hypothetical protein